MKFCKRSLLIIFSALLVSDFGLCSEGEAQITADQIVKKRKHHQILEVTVAAEGCHSDKVSNPSSSSLRSDGQSIVVFEESVQSENETTAVNFLANGSKLSWRKAFLAAIQADDPGRIKSLGSECHDAHFRMTSPLDPSYSTYPLNFALQHKLEYAAEYIIGNLSFDPDALDSFGHTPLSLALGLEDRLNFFKLLEVSNLDTAVRGGLGLAHFAASITAVDPLFLVALQEKGLDFKAVCGIRGWTPLQYAVTANNAGSTKWIIDSTDGNLGFSKNKEIVLDALKAGNSSLAETLIKWGAPFNISDEEGGNIFHVIAKTGRVEIFPFIVSLLDPKIAFRARDAVKGFCPVHYAAESDNVDLIELFRKHQHNSLGYKTSDGRSLLEVAIDSAAVGVIFHLSAGGLVDWEDCCFVGAADSPILVISYIKLKDHPRKIEVISALFGILSEDDRYLFDKNGLNIVHHAIIHSDIEMLKVFKETFDFDLNYMDNTLMDPLANSPLSWAIFCKQLEIVKYLLENGACIRERVRISLFTPEEEGGGGEDDDDDDDVFDLKSLSEIFGGEEITNLLVEYLPSMDF